MELYVKTFPLSFHFSWGLYHIVGWIFLFPIDRSQCSVFCIPAAINRSESSVSNTHRPLFTLLKYWHQS